MIAKSLRSHVFWLLVAAPFCGFAVPANAGLVGYPIEVEWAYPTITSQYGNLADVTVANGTQIDGFISGNPTFDIEFTATGVIISGARDGCCFADTTFNGLIFVNYTDEIPDFSGVTLTGNDWAGFDTSRISFDAGDIYVNFAGLTFSTGDSVTLNIDTAAVPEPPAIADLPAGMLALAWIVRRRSPRRS